MERRERREALRLKQEAAVREREEEQRRAQEAQLRAVAEKRRLEEAQRKEELLRKREAELAKLRCVLLFTWSCTVAISETGSDFLRSRWS